MKGLDIEDFFARIEIGKISLIKQLVEYGCGITFLYQTAVKRNWRCQLGRFQKRELSGR